LEFSWFHSEDLHTGTTVAALAARFADALADLARHAARPASAGRTPSDFPLARLDQAAVDRIAGDDPGAVEDVHPLTPTQTGMLFHGLSQDDRGVYFQQLTFDLDGVPDPAALAAAWQRVTDRTPVLRAHVVWQDVPEPLLVVRHRATVPVTHLDWRDLTEEERGHRLRDLLEQDRERGIDLDRAPLQRLVLARTSDGAVRVVWSFHHLVLDGWSLFQVLSDVFTQHATAGREPLPERRPFRDYVAWLRERDAAQADRHWQARLAGLSEATALPYDREPRESHRAESTAAVRATVDEATTRSLEELARTAGLTLNTLVQGAWAMLLSRQARRADVVFGTTVSGRPPELPGADTMTGLFITTLPTRVTVPHDRPLLDWLRDLQQEQSEDRRHDHVPLTRMKGFTGLPERTALFDSIVVFENYPVDDGLAAAHGLRLSALDGIETTNYPLSLVAYPGTALGLRLGYDPRLFDADTAGRMVEHLAVLLANTAALPQCPPARLPLLTADRRRQVVEEWNDTATDLPGGTVAELFAAQVRRTPDAVALEADARRLTYRELDALAARLAHRLTALGVAAEVPVGVLADRSADLVVVQLALVRTGGVYVPLDGRAPRERLRGMLAEAGACLLLTDAGRQDAARKALPDGTVLRVDDLLAADVDAAVVRRAITEQGVRCLWLTAGLFRLLAQEDPTCLRGAREVWCGGWAVAGAVVG
ncbi:condensation domain-containing protein, partial [Streptomyces apricus]